MRKDPGSAPEVGEAKAKPKYSKNLKSQMFSGVKIPKTIGNWDNGPRTHQRITIQILENIKVL
jgi:hypothetical protein